ncbi:MAG: CSLREA domain-containing protein [Nitrospirales bacterium]|nr:CSLREA domain-containing protein [Nitrospirales bacterium]
MSLAVLLPLVTSGCMTYRVNSLADAPDANPGDRKCERAVPGGTRTGAPDGLCTLRAAVMESNASVWKDTVEVPGGLYQLTLPVAAGGGHLPHYGRRQDTGCRCRKNHHRRQPCRYCAVCPKRRPRTESCASTRRQQSGWRRDPSLCRIFGVYEPGHSPEQCPYGRGRSISCEWCPTQITA